MRVMQLKAARNAAMFATTAVMIAGLSGCGGADRPAAAHPAALASAADSDQIVKLATEMVTSTDAQRKCNLLSTPEFVTAVYGDVTTCADKEHGDDSATRSTGATIDSVRVNRDTATAVVTTHGGAFDGTSGTWTFTRTDGSWRVSEWGTDYVRSAMSSLLGPNYRAGGDDPLGNAEVRRCVSSAIQARDDQALRGLVFATMQGRTQQLEQLITGCARQGPDTASADIAATDTSDAGIPKAALDTSYLAFSSAAARAEQRVRSDLANADRAALIADIEAIRDSVSEFDKSVRTIQVPDSARAEFARLLEADSATVGDLEAMSASTTGSELAAAANRLQNDAPGIDTAYVALLNAVSASPA